MTAQTERCVSPPPEAEQTAQGQPAGWCLWPVPSEPLGLAFEYPLPDARRGNGTVAARRQRRGQNLTALLEGCVHLLPAVAPSEQGRTDW